MLVIASRFLKHSENRITNEDNPLQAPIDNAMLNICACYFERDKFIIIIEVKTCPGQRREAKLGNIKPTPVSVSQNEVQKRSSSKQSAFQDQSIIQYDRRRRFHASRLQTLLLIFNGFLDACVQFQQDSKAEERGIWA